MCSKGFRFVYLTKCNSICSVFVCLWNPFTIQQNIITQLLIKFVFPELALCLGCTLGNSHHAYLFFVFFCSKGQFEIDFGWNINQQILLDATFSKLINMQLFNRKVQTSDWQTDMLTVSQTTLILEFEFFYFRIQENCKQVKICKSTSVRKELLRNIHSTTSKVAKCITLWMCVPQVSKYVAGTSVL